MKCPRCKCRVGDDVAVCPKCYFGIVRSHIKPQAARIVSSTDNSSGIFARPPIVATVNNQPGILEHTDCQIAPSLAQAKSETFSRSNHVETKVSPKVIEFEDCDDWKFEQHLDKMIGDEELDIQVIKENKAEIEKPNRNELLGISEEVELLFDIDLENEDTSKDDVGGSVTVPTKNIKIGNQKKESLPMFLDLYTASAHAHTFPEVVEQKQEPLCDILNGLIGDLEKLERLSSEDKLVAMFDAPKELQQIQLQYPDLLEQLIAIVSEDYALDLQGVLALAQKRSSKPTSYSNLEDLSDLENQLNSELKLLQESGASFAHESDVGAVEFEAILNGSLCSSTSGNVPVPIKSQTDLSDIFSMFDIADTIAQASGASNTLVPSTEEPLEDEVLNAFVKELNDLQGSEEEFDPFSADISKCLWSSDDERASSSLREVLSNNLSSEFGNVSSNNIEVSCDEVKKCEDEEPCAEIASDVPILVSTPSESSVSVETKVELSDMFSMFDIADTIAQASGASNTLVPSTEEPLEDEVLNAFVKELNDLQGSEEEFDPFSADISKCLWSSDDERASSSLREVLSNNLSSEFGNVSSNNIEVSCDEVKKCEDEEPCAEIASDVPILVSTPSESSVSVETKVELSDMFSMFDIANTIAQASGASNTLVPSTAEPLEDEVLNAFVKELNDLQDSEEFDPFSADISKCLWSSGDERVSSSLREVLSNNLSSEFGNVSSNNIEVSCDEVKKCEDEEPCAEIASDVPILVFTPSESSVSVETKVELSDMFSMFDIANTIAQASGASNTLVPSTEEPLEDEVSNAFVKELNDLQGSEEEFDPFSADISKCLWSFGDERVSSSLREVLSNNLSSELEDITLNTFRVLHDESLRSEEEESSTLSVLLSGCADLTSELEPVSAKQDDYGSPIEEYGSIGKELWDNASAELVQMSTELDDSFEISLTDILHIKQNDRLDLLFDLVDEDLINPRARRASHKDMPTSDNRKVLNVALKEAFVLFDKEEQSHNTKVVVPAVIEIRAAPVWRRMLSFVADLTVYCLLVVLILVIQNSSQLVFMGEASRIELCRFIMLYCIWALWALILVNSLLGFAIGQTLGQKLLNIEVVDSLGQMPDLLTSALRAMSMFTTLFSCGLGLLPMLWGSKQPLHDRMAATYVRCK